MLLAQPGPVYTSGVAAPSNQRIKRSAVEIISELFGPDTARQYQIFYEDKPDATVLASLDELLYEIVGPSEARARTAPLKKLIKGVTP